MYRASDYRSLARNSLKGRWTIAVLAGFVASLLGAVTTSGPSLEFHFQEGHINLGISIGSQQLFSFPTVLSPELQSIIVGRFVFFILFLLVMAVAMLLVSSVIHLGYCKFNLDLVDLQNPQLNTLFAYFSHWKTAVCTSLLQTLYVILWSLLLIIPGIMATYSYAMTGYILAENPYLTAREAISRSKYLMQGNRWRLFCLEFSFFGWNILAALSFGIGNLWLVPYRQAAFAEFYRDISRPVAQPNPNYPPY